MEDDRERRKRNIDAVLSEHQHGKPSQKEESAPKVAKKSKSEPQAQTTDVTIQESVSSDQNTAQDASAEPKVADQQNDNHHTVESSETSNLPPLEENGRSEPVEIKIYHNNSKDEKKLDPVPASQPSAPTFVDWTLLPDSPEEYEGILIFGSLIVPGGTASPLIKITVNREKLIDYVRKKGGDLYMDQDSLLIRGPRMITSFGYSPQWDEKSKKWGVNLRLEYDRNRAEIVNFRKKMDVIDAFVLSQAPHHLGQGVRESDKWPIDGLEQGQIDGGGKLLGILIKSHYVNLFHPPSKPKDKLAAEREYLTLKFDHEYIQNKDGTRTETCDAICPVYGESGNLITDRLLHHKHGYSMNKDDMIDREPIICPRDIIIPLFAVDRLVFWSKTSLGCRIKGLRFIPVNRNKKPDEYCPFMNGDDKA